MDVDVADPVSPPECEVPQCVETGFLSDPDGFSFANWSDTGALDASSLVDMFGEEAVCIQGGADECLLSPSADQWLTQANSAMTVGHCEGMAVLAQEIFQGTRPLEAFQPQCPLHLRPGSITARRRIDRATMGEPAAPGIFKPKPRSFGRWNPVKSPSLLSTSLQSGATYVHHGFVREPRSWSHGDANSRSVLRFRMGSAAVRQRFPWTGTGALRL